MLYNEGQTLTDRVYVNLRLTLTPVAAAGGRRQRSVVAPRGYILEITPLIWVISRM